jgi:outer membrane murein-binding lipoprotein Lpp
MNLRKNIMAQFIVGALLLVLCLVALTLSQKEASAVQNQLRDWQGQVSKLELDVASLQQQAQHYKLNAPRDFESYNRDVAVFYKQFQQLLTSISTTTESAQIPANNVQKNSAYSALFSNDNAVEKAIDQQASWRTFWTTFLSNLKQEIGSPSEPRLEWAADHIISTQSNLSSRTQALYTKVEQANQWFSQSYEQVSWLISGAVLVFISLILALFAQYIVRPIVSTTKVCKEVAAGEYGKKVTVNGVGEARQLQEAFNDLSSRSKLLMDMLGDVNKPGDVPTKLQRIYNSGKDALGCSWIGLMAFNENRAELNSSVPAALDANFKHRHVTLNKAFGRDLLSALDTQWLDLPALRQLSIKRHDERFLRELHKNTMAQHIVGYSFKCPSHNEFILMFACNQVQGFTPQQTDIIKALSKLMADGIISGLDYNAEKNVA